METLCTSYLRYNKKYIFNIYVSYARSCVSLLWQISESTGLNFPRLTGGSTMCKELTSFKLTKNFMLHYTWAKSRATAVVICYARNSSRFYTTWPILSCAVVLRVWHGFWVSMQDQCRRWNSPYFINLCLLNNPDNFR